MLAHPNRHARKYDSRRSLRPGKPPLRGLRWAACLAALAIAGLGAVSAQASTGGASAYEAPPTATTSSPEGEEIAFSPMRYGGASWYGPGLWGRKTACGQTLRPNTLGVAHKTLPCGTNVKFVYHGHVLITQVIDRGPYVHGRAWDLTAAASKALGFESAGVGRVGYAVEVSYARR
jgi:hypothetical protein